MKTTSLSTELETTIAEFIKLVHSFTPEQLNTVPFEGSWTAAQVAEHVYKSSSSIIQALTSEGIIPGRQPDTRIKELKDTFLNFEIKFQSGKFITPGDGVYEKETMLAKLQESFNRIKELSATVNVSEMISNRALGDITKLELLHFFVYHTQRHAHQLQNIGEIVKKK